MSTADEQIEVIKRWLHDRLPDMVAKAQKTADDAKLTALEASLGLQETDKTVSAHGRQNLLIMEVLNKFVRRLKWNNVVTGLIVIYLAFPYLVNLFRAVQQFIQQRFNLSVVESILSILASLVVLIGAAFTVFRHIKSNKQA